MVDDTPHTGASRRLLVILVILAVAGGIVWLGYARSHQGGPAQGGRFAHSGPMPVAAVAAQKGNIDITVNALGTVTPLATVTLRSQIAGRLMELDFHEGQVVKEGDMLALVDPRPYQIALAQAQGQLQRDQAVLEGAERDLKRYAKLVAEDSIARQQMDTQKTLVDQYGGIVETDQAAIDTAKLNLEYCRITAPLTGRIGLRQVDPGNYVQVNDANGIAILTQTHPITVLFSLPEDDLQAVLMRLKAGAVLPVTAFDRSQTTKLADGKLSTVDNQVDTATGTVKMRAQFANDDDALFPNQFVNVQLLIDTVKDAIVIPSSAVRSGAQGSYVFVVQPDSTVKMTGIKTGPAQGERIAVVSGLSVGDVVVTDGADKLKDGDKVLMPGARQEGQGEPPAAEEKAPPGGPAEHPSAHRRRRPQQ